MSDSCCLPPILGNLPLPYLKHVTAVPPLLSPSPPPLLFSRRLTEFGALIMMADDAPADSKRLRNVPEIFVQAQEGAGGRLAVGTARCRHGRECHLDVHR